jgi:hypothetical protein
MSRSAADRWLTQQARARDRTVGKVAAPPLTVVRLTTRSTVGVGISTAAASPSHQRSTSASGGPAPSVGAQAASPRSSRCPSSCMSVKLRTCGVLPVLLTTMSGARSSQAEKPRMDSAPSAKLKTSSPRPSSACLRARHAVHSSGWLESVHSSQARTAVAAAPGGVSMVIAGTATVSSSRSAQAAACWTRRARRIAFSTSAVCVRLVESGGCRKAAGKAAPRGGAGSRNRERGRPRTRARVASCPTVGCASPSAQARSSSGSRAVASARRTSGRPSSSKAQATTAGVTGTVLTAMSASRLRLACSLPDDHRPTVPSNSD